MNKKLIKNYFVMLIILALCFGDFVPLLGRIDFTAFAAIDPPTATQTQETPLEQSEGVIRPEDIDEGLSINGLDDIRGRRVTVRQPVMEILADDIERPQVKVMDNTYEMLPLKDDDEKFDVEVKYDFSKNGTRVVGDEKKPMYPMKGLKNSPRENGQVTEQLYFSEYEKYLLLRQAYYFNLHAKDIIKNDELMKHPAADYIYGAIPETAKAVKMHIVTDPIYRSPMTTGLYLAPGETVTVKLSGLKKGEILSFYTHHQDTLGYQGYKQDGSGCRNMEEYIDYWDQIIVDETKKGNADFSKYNFGIHGQWMWQNQKVPCMGTTFDFVGTGEDMTVEIGSMYGGPLYIKPTTSAIDLEITGALLTPHFVLGVTTVEEFEQQLREAPGLIATLDVENGQLIGPADAMRKCDDIEKLAYFWHSVFAIDISLNGREYNYNMTMCYDMHVPAGEAVALNSNFCAQPEYWFPICMNYERLTTQGNWGTFHELGHVQAKTHGVNWGFCDGDGEVWNNTLILLIYSMLCNMDTRLIGVEHGEYVHPFTAIERSRRITQTYVDKTTGATVKIDDYGKINEGNGAHFDQLSMYATLLHSFGPEKFVDMFYTYKMNPAYCENKRADFAYRIGVVDRVNILDWVNSNYFANIDDNMFSTEQLDFLHNLPRFVPVAYRWANGMDGHETARKYDVDGTRPTVFDLSEGNISSPEDVDILAVTSAHPERIEYNQEAQRVTYTPPTDPIEYDSFDILVKTAGGRRVTLNVNLRLVYRDMYGKVWLLGNANTLGNDSKPQVARAKEMIKENGVERPCDYNVSYTSANWAFNNQVKDYNPVEYAQLQFKYRAPKAGEYVFYVKSDDCSETRFYKNNSAGESLGTISISGYTGNFSPNHSITKTLSANETVFIDCDLVNWGGPGGITFGVHTPETPENEIVTIPAENILSADVQDKDLPTIDSFKGWQPQFVDSIKNATIDSRASNSGWTVELAPTAIGNDPNAKNNLVDGDEATSFHSIYQPKREPTPHVFIIDTKADQTFNYFEVVRRTNGNDRLYQYALYSCTDDQYANAKHSAEDKDSKDGWTVLFDGASSNVNAARQRISFPRTTARYFKFIVRDNGSKGGTLDGNTVIKEIYAGVESQLNQTVKPSTYMEEGARETLKENKDTANGFVENSANGKLTTTKSNVKFEFSFLGSGFEVFADVAPGYGKATIKVDNGQEETIDLDEDNSIFNTLVYHADGLETQVHNVVITTTEQKLFNISFINVQYGTPVAVDEYPATEKDGKPDYGDVSVKRQFTREWKTYVKDYKSLTSIKFVKGESAPTGYKDTYVRVDTYIRLYRLDAETEHKVAFVYPGTILSPIECGSLFSGCEALTEIDFANFDTEFMRGAMSMFYGCKSLTNLDVSNFNTENVLSYGRMFAGCTGLTSLNLGNFKLDDNSNLYRMFENCDNLSTINLPNMSNQATAVAAEDDKNAEITCELPYVYKDDTQGDFVTDIVLKERAGHKLTLHKQHNFDNSAERTHQQVDPQCEVPGCLAYKTCTECNCDFDLTTGTTLYRKADLVIPATGHNLEYTYPEDPSQFSTCTKPGVPVQQYCKNCNRVFEESIEMPAIGHSYTLDKQAEGTDGKGYKLEVRKIEVDDSIFDDEEVDDRVVDENAARYEITITFYFLCQGYSDWGDIENDIPPTPCGDRREVSFTFASDAHTLATCNEAESYFFDFSVNKAMLQQAIIDNNDDDTPDVLTDSEVNVYTSIQQVFEVAPRLEHVYSTIAAVPATCHTMGSTAGRMCTLCGFTTGIDDDHESIETTPMLSHSFKQTEYLAPTCTEPGHKAGRVCELCGDPETEDLYLAPNGHTFVDVDAILPTCTEVGRAAGKMCSVCGHPETGCETLLALGHEDSVMPGKDPTATEPGFTEEHICSRCGEVLQASEEIPALGLPEDDPGMSPTPAVQPWVWALVGVGSAMIVAGIAVAVIMILKKKRKF